MCCVFGGGGRGADEWYRGEWLAVRGEIKASEG